jgi:hypothetical protein
MSEQQVPPVGRYREPVGPGLSNRQEEINWARRRPPGQRASKPAAGQIVGLRLEAGGPVLRAQIVKVRDAPPADTRPGAEIDWNVWRYTLRVGDRRKPAAPVEVDEAGNRAVELVDDPWWDVLAETLEGPRMRVECREARLPGSPGWLAEG